MEECDVRKVSTSLSIVTIMPHAPGQQQLPSFGLVAPYSHARKFALALLRDNPTLRRFAAERPALPRYNACMRTAAVCIYVSQRHLFVN